MEILAAGTSVACGLKPELAFRAKVFTRSEIHFLRIIQSWGTDPMSCSTVGLEGRAQVYGLPIVTIVS